MSFAYLPLYTGDYLRDTRHLSMAEHGAYLLMLTYCWDQKGPLPLDRRQIHGICNARSKDEQEAVERVLHDFFVVMDDGLYNERMQDELVKWNYKSQQYREAGLKSAEMRRARSALREQKETTVEPTVNVGSTDVERWLVTPSPSPSLTLEEQQPARKRADPFPLPGFETFWQAWPKSERKQAKGKCQAEWTKGKFETVAEKIVAHVELLKRGHDWTKERGAYIPAPLVYLHKRGWEGADLVAQVEEQRLVI